MPSPTAIANLLIADTPFAVNKGVVYQISSGIVHGLSWGLRQSGYELAVSDLHSEAIHSRVRQQMPEGAGGVVIASFIATMRRARDQLGWGKITLGAFGEPAMPFFNSGPNVV
jgi:hypothetical protein